MTYCLVFVIWNMIPTKKHTHTKFYSGQGFWLNITEIHTISSAHLCARCASWMRWLHGTWGTPAGKKIVAIGSNLLGKIENPQKRPLAPTAAWAGRDDRIAKVLAAHQLSMMVVYLIKYGLCVFSAVWARTLFFKFSLSASTTLFHSFFHSCYYSLSRPLPRPLSLSFSVSIPLACSLSFFFSRAFSRSRWLRSCLWGA